MTDLTKVPPEPPGFDLSISRQWIIELAALSTPPEEVRAQAARMFDAQNPEQEIAKAQAVLATAAASAKALLHKQSAQAKATDAIETLITAQTMGKPHRLFRTMGGVTALLCLTLIVPLVVVVAAGVEDSLLIERVIEAPHWALAYGTAPIGGLIAAHSLRDTFTTDRARRWFDRVAFGAAVTAFGVWASSFGPVFLSDPLAGGFDAITTTKETLSDWYKYHLALEFFGGVAAYSAATSLLTYGARKTSAPNPEAQALQVTIADSTARSLALAADCDALAVRPRHRNAARAAFQDRVQQKVDLARQLLAARQATDGIAALAEVMRDWKDFDTEETSHG